MTHPQPGHAENPYAQPLEEARLEYVDQMALPPRSTGLIVSAAEHFIPTAPEVGDDYDAARKDYKSKTTDYIYEELMRPKLDKDGNIIPGKEALTDNSDIIGRAITELEGNFNDVYAGKIVTRRKRNLLGKLKDEKKEVSGGRFNTFYKKNRLKRMGGKALGVATVAGSGWLLGQAYYEASPGLVGTGLMAAGATAAYVGTTIRKPSPVEYRAQVDVGGAVPSKDKTADYTKIETMVSGELKALGFEEGREADADTVHNLAQAQAEGIKGRSSYKKTIRRVSGAVAQYTESRTSSADLDLERLRVVVTVELVDDMLRRIREREMKRERRKYGLYRAMAGIAVAVTIASWQASSDKSALENQQRIDQIDPIHHGDTSNQMTNVDPDTILPGTDAPRTTIVIPTTR